MSKPTRPRPVASNRRAHHEYAILDTFEAGIVLFGSEVKSLRDGHVQLADGFARVEDGELWLEHVHIAPWSYAHGVGAVDPDRRRKLLMHRAEIDKLAHRVREERLTLVPLAVYFKDGRAKVELGLAKGRQKADRRQSMAERDADRDMQRYLGRVRKGMHG